MISGGRFLFLGVLLLAAPQAALLPLLDRDEPRFAEASREMLQSGNFVVPTFNHAPRYAKPPLIYWAQAASFSVLGENAFSARLPSLLATAGTAVLLFVWGCELGGWSAGLIAALSYAFCLQAMQQGRVATADALLIFCTTLSGFAGWKLLRARESQVARGWNSYGTLLAVALAGGFLAKGPEALLPILPLFWILRRRGARVLLALLAIFALGMLLVACWAIPAYVQTDGAYWREGLGHDVGDRMVTGFQGHGASSLGWYLLELPLYFVLFWISALPSSVLAVIQRRRIFTWKNHDEADVYLLLNAALFFGIFSLMVTKLPHYTLPAFPFLALLFAKRWMANGLLPDPPVKAAILTGLVLSLIALVLVPLCIVPYANPSPADNLVREAATALTPDTEFALVDYQEPNTIWEMRRIVRGYGRVIAPDLVLFFLHEHGGRAVLLTSEAWEKLHLQPAGRVGWTIFSARGWNAAKGSFVDLTLVVTGNPDRQALPLRMRSREE